MYCALPKKILFILCIYFVVQSELVPTSGSEINPLAVTHNSKHVCGHLKFLPNSSFYIYDREDHNADLEEILISEFHEEFYSLRVKDGCQMKLCVIDFFNPKPTRQRVCYTFDTTEIRKDYLQYFYVITISCSCKEITPECDKHGCEAVSLHENECARLYTERNCQECYHDHVSLNTTSSLVPSNSFTAESFVVKEGCHFDIKNTATSEDSPPEFSYYETHEFIQLAFSHIPKPSHFTCSCDVRNNIAKEMLSGWDTKYSESPIVFVVTITIALIISGLLPAVSIFNTLRTSVKTNQNELNAIGRFHVGEQDSTNFTEPNITTCVSFGYIQALKLPYQKIYEIPRNRIKIDSTKTLGDGAFGKVFLGILRSRDNISKDTSVAVKVAKWSTNLPYFLSLLDEIKILTFIGSHPNIVGLVGACTESIERRDALIILELCERGNMKKYLIENKKTFLDSNCGLLKDNPTCDITLNTSGYTTLSSFRGQYVTIKPDYMRCCIKWAINIASGLEYLNGKQIVHADIAARNILLTDELVAKISDFGLSQKVKEVANYIRIGSQCPLPFRHMAPESLIDYRFSPHSDAWSYGVTLWEMYSFGEDPYVNIANYYHLVHFLNSNQRLEKPLHSPTDIYEEMQRCWAYNPADRPSFTELKEFFESVNNR